MDNQRDSLVGFRFQPTNEEIIRLLKKKRLDPEFSVRTIKEINIYKFEPWELPRYAEIQSKEEVWYFFCEPYYPFAKSKRAHRKTKEGYWKKTGNGSKLKRRNSPEVIGTKHILPFCPRDSASKSRKAATEWVIHEFVVDDEDNPLYKKDYVVCRLERKRKPGRKPGVVSSIDDDDNKSSQGRNYVAENMLMQTQQLPALSIDDYAGYFLGADDTTNRNHVAENMSWQTQQLPALSYDGANDTTNRNHAAENMSMQTRQLPVPVLSINDNAGYLVVADDTTNRYHAAGTEDLVSKRSHVVENIVEAEPQQQQQLAEFDPLGDFNGPSIPYFSALQSPVNYPEQESSSSYSNGSSYGSGLLNSQSDGDQFNLLTDFQNGSSWCEETGQSTPDDVISSKSCEGFDADSVAFLNEIKIVFQY